MSQPNDKERNETVEVLKGLGLSLLVIPLVALVINQVAPHIEGVRIVFTIFVLVQALYFAIAILLTRSRKRYGMMKGLIIGAAVAFLLNSACYGLLLRPLGAV